MSKNIDLNKLYKDILDKVNKHVEQELKNAKVEIGQVVDKCGKQATKSLYEEAIDMYDSLIEQYYEYETKSYYRHNAGVGTGWGDNLYYGKNFSIQNDELFIEFSGDKMEKYKKASRDEVLNIVKAGFRGVPGKWIRPWSGSYDGLYFSIGKTNIDKAFDIFIKNYKYMYESALRDNIIKETKTGKYKYI